MDRNQGLQHQVKDQRRVTSKVACTCTSKIVLKCQSRSSAQTFRRLPRLIAPGGQLGAVGRALNMEPVHSSVPNLLGSGNAKKKVQCRF